MDPLMTGTVRNNDCFYPDSFIGRPLRGYRMVCKLGIGNHSADIDHMVDIEGKHTVRCGFSQTSHGTRNAEGKTAGIGKF